jgi:hypothetical protein
LKRGFQEWSWHRLMQIPKNITLGAAVIDLLVGRNSVYAIYYMVYDGGIANRGLTDDKH